MGTYHYDEKTKTFTIKSDKAGLINNYYPGGQQPPIINPFRIAWNIDDVNTDEIEIIKIDLALLLSTAMPVHYLLIYQT